MFCCLRQASERGLWSCAICALPCSAHAACLVMSFEAGRSAFVLASSHQAGSNFPAGALVVLGTRPSILVVGGRRASVERQTSRESPRQSARCSALLWDARLAVAPGGLRFGFGSPVLGRLFTRKKSCSSGAGRVPGVESHRRAFSGPVGNSDWQGRTGRTAKGVGLGSY